ncbi:MAG: radical SAM protein [Candidatus Moranbacteria bacterium]|nr:radical SAM protein [Candidatus Moranbacteria bacterium]
MVIQVEVTTVCNFECGYCTIRHYPHKMLSMAAFKALVEPHLRSAQVTEFRLNGTGEPLLHPEFWDMARHIKARSPRAAVTTISNGSVMTKRHQDAIIRYLSWLFISIDTTDVAQAGQMGRHGIDKVILHLRELVARGYRAITLLAVDYGQDYTDVRQLAEDLGIQFASKPLQPKNDYREVYDDRRLTPQLAPVPDLINTVTCPFIQRDILRFYTIDGVEMPCCFIRDTTDYAGRDALKTDMEQGVIPGSCRGCGFLSFNQPGR